MKRYLYKPLSRDIGRKILLLTGPRQCGKTTLSQMLCSDYQYLNHDLAEHRLILGEKSWDRSKALIIFDELHKMQNWKAWLKGIYDVEGMPPAMIVTGSARLDAFRKVGDSLAGRHFQFRLHPVDFKEALQYTDLDPVEILDRLLSVGGFPEPFLNGARRYYNRWKRSHIDLILREDLISLSAVRDVQSIETLIELLRTRVGNPVSASSLARDLQKSPATIQSWLRLLEDLYVIFRISPHHRNVARSLLKEPKYYFYDNGMVRGEEGMKLENLVACTLLKEIHRAQDVYGVDVDLRYLRNKDGHEIDFLITHNLQPLHMLEVKWSDTSLSSNFKKLLNNETRVSRTQVVGQIAQNKSYASGERIESAITFFRSFTLDQLES